MQNSIKIAVFDFDYTIINANSSTFLNKLVIEAEFLEKKQPIRTPSIAELNRFKYPEEVEKYRDERNFTLLYQQIFRYMYNKYGINKQKMEKCLKEIRISESMKNLFKVLNENGFELMIVSDSNTFVIEKIIEQNNLTEFFGNRIFANQVDFDSDGQVTILPCIDVKKFDRLNCVKDTCRENICKRFVIDNFLSKKIGFTKQIIYVGDGKIDFCAGVGLRNCDIFFVKKNSSLARFIQNEINKNKIEADIKIWKNANDILNYLFFNKN